MQGERFPDWDFAKPHKYGKIDAAMANDIKTGNDQRWLVTYRGKDGKPTVVELGAADRADLFRQLDAKHIFAIKVEQATGRAAKARRRASGATGRGSSGLFKGIAAAAIVVIGAMVAWMALAPRAEEPKEEMDRKQAKIAEVTPAPVAPVKAEEPVVEKPKPLRKWEYPVDRTNELSAAELRKWKVMHRPPPGYTNDTARTEAPPEYAIFNHHSENEIACLLTITPGTTLVGTPIYGKRFIDDFMKSCEEPIVITEDDTPEQAELKQAMIDTKIDLRQRMADGEDLGQILLDTRAEYQRLAAYKQTLQQELNELKKDDSLSMEDIDDFVEAANKMLEDKGIAPIKLSPISRRMLMRRRGQY